MLGDMERKFRLMIFGFLVFSLVPFSVMDVGAIGMPGEMYAGTARNTITAGAVYTVSQTGPLVETLVGDPTAGTEGLQGLAFDSTGELYGTTVDGNIAPSVLLEISPTTGGVLDTLGIIEDSSGNQLKINDLSIQPGTDTIFGVTSSQDPTYGSGQLFTISYTSPPIATTVGPNNGLTSDETPIAFAPDGTLYMICNECSIGGGQKQLLTVNPTTGVIQTQVSLSTSVAVTGLGVRGDGTIFASTISGNSIHTISTTGTTTLVGVSDERYTDLTFLPIQDVPVGGTFIPIDQSALLLAGVQSV